MLAINGFSLLSILIVLYVIGPARLELAGIPSNKFFLLALVAYCVCRKRVNCKLKWFTVLYLITVFAVNLYHFTISNLMWSILEIVFILMVVPLHIKNESDFFKLIDTFLVIAGGLAILGIFETFTGFNIFDTLSGNYVVKYGANSMRFGLTRSRGLLTTSINNAAFLGMSATLCAYRIPIIKFKKAFIFIYIVLLLNLVSTMSRGAILIFGAVQLVMWWKNKVITNIVKILKITMFVCFSFFVMNLIGIPVIAILKNIFNMMAVIFDSRFGESISDDFGTNLYGVGTRLQLFGFVWEAVKNKLFLGNGYQSHFAVSLTSTITKTSIENTFLGYLFYGGFVGLFGFVGMLGGVLTESLKECKYVAEFEITMSFGWMMVLLTIAYAITMFTVYAVDDLRLFYMLVCMLLAYLRVHNTPKSSRLVNS